MRQKLISAFVSLTVLAAPSVGAAQWPAVVSASPVQAPSQTRCFLNGSAFRGLVSPNFRIHSPPVCRMARCRLRSRRQIDTRSPCQFR